MKSTAFILSYAAPLAMWLLLFDIAGRGFSLRSFGLLVPAVLLALIAFTGLDLFEFRERMRQKKSSELAMRGGLGGLALIGCILVAPSLVSFRVAFYSSLIASVLLAPIALFAPFRRAKKQPIQPPEPTSARASRDHSRLI